MMRGSSTPLKRESWVVFLERNLEGSNAIPLDDALL
jgi:hypothetical protein